MVDVQLIFLMDPHCGWCFGYADTIMAFHDEVVADSEVGLSVIPGGLFIPKKQITQAFVDGKRPIAEKISKLFGVAFSPAYFTDVLGGPSIDSTSSCKGVCVANLIDASKSVHFSVALIKAAFAHGRDISKQEIVVEVAGEQGFDVQQFGDLMGSEAAEESLRRSLAFARQVGTGFPSLLHDGDTELTYVGGSNLTLLALKDIVGKLRAGEQPLST